MPPTAWFISAVGASAVFLFIDKESWHAAIAASVVTVLLVMLSNILQSVHGSPRGPRNATWGLTELLEYIWNYPLRGDPQRSWATKESAVILGEVASGAERPGLGIAIVTTELAQFAFASEAESRLDAVVSWAFERCETTAPHRMMAEVRNPISSGTIEFVPDLRHTMALAIILLRTNRELHRAATYLELALAAQEKNGAWLPPDPMTDSTVFTTLYGVELVDLALRAQPLPGSLLGRLPQAHQLGITWLMRNRSVLGLWSTDVFKTEPWDCVMATGWVLHRSLRAPNRLRAEWESCVETATGELIRLIETPATWMGCSEQRRFRVEARAAGGIRRALRASRFPASVEASARRYLGSWQLAAPKQLSHLGFEQLDVGTATFAAWAFADTAELRRIGRQVAAA